jgi:hypothetical protein
VKEWLTTTTTTSGGPEGSFLMNPSQIDAAQKV